jgi:hypothetical protein
MNTEKTNLDLARETWANATKDRDGWRASLPQAMYPMLTLDQARIQLGSILRARGLAMPRIEASAGGRIALGRLKTAAPGAWESPGTIHPPTALPPVRAVPNRDEWVWTELPCLAATANPQPTSAKHPGLPKACG